jgi:ActR/RegA family two-component response regulator
MKIQTHLINFPEDLRKTIVDELKLFPELEITVSTLGTMMSSLDSMALIYLAPLKWKEQLKEIREWKKNHQTQLLVVCKSDNIPTGIASLKAGAFDYVVWNKEHFDHLQIAIHSFLQVVRTKKKLQEYSALLNRFKRIEWTLPLILLAGFIIWLVFR